MKCPLCDQEVSALHKRSHLIPEWSYQKCYNENHKLVHFSIDNEFAAKKQKGLYDEIICESCESQSQIYDRYASLIFVENSAYPTDLVNKHIIHEGNIIYERWVNLDFHKLQKFVFICILRTHISQRKNGKMLLPEKHFKRMKGIYLNDLKLNYSTYPVMIIKYSDLDGFGDVIFIPYTNKRDGHHVIEFSCGGYQFQTYVSSHEKPEYTKWGSLNSDNSTIVLRLSIKETGTFKGAKSKLISMARKMPLK